MVVLEPMIYLLRDVDERAAVAKLRVDRVLDVEKAWAPYVARFARGALCLIIVSPPVIQRMHGPDEKKKAPSNVDSCELVLLPRGN